MLTSRRASTMASVFNVMVTSFNFAIVFWVSIPVHGRGELPFLAGGRGPPAGRDDMRSEGGPRHPLRGCVCHLLGLSKWTPQQAHGFADVAGQVAMSPQTLFRLYSQTKPILVIGFLILFERGAVLLDDPVGKYLPEFKNAAVGPQRKPLLRPMLVRDLLAHTSGIGFGPGFGCILSSQ